MPMPQVINHQDELLTVNLNDNEYVTDPMAGVKVKPLFLDKENGTWVLFMSFPPGTLLPRHFHTGTVHFFTTKGTWNYVEYPDQPQTEGSYLYEPGGSVHQFMVPEDATENAEGFMVVSGANINFDDEDNFIDVTDASSIEASILGACQMMGQAVPQYIRPGGEATYTGGGEPLAEAAE